MKRPAVFLDLNGTLALPLKVDHPSALASIPGAARAIRRLSANGYVCPVVTIQSRIGKNIFTAEDFSAWFRGFQLQFAAEGAILAGPYVCPHPFSVDCPCKKPKSFLYQQAAEDHQLELAASYVIGDTGGDVAAAAQFGGKGILVRTGYGEDDDAAAVAGRQAAFVGRDLGECIAWILR
jgi:D-glycero-D-manno-heptose 1,7-bisphosphate phosphatase